MAGVAAPLQCRQDIRILVRITTSLESGVTMSWCQTRRSTSPMETSPSTSARRSSPATTSRRRSRPPFVATSTSRKAGARASTRSSSGSGPARVGRSGSPASSSGEWLNSSFSRVETFRVYRGRTGKFVLHIERSPDYTMVDARGQAGRLARLSRASATSATGTRRRVDPRGRRVARGAPRPDPAPALRHGRRPGPAARVEDLDI